MSQEVREIIANNIKRLREERKIKREELSIRLGFDTSYISKLERKSINITIDRLAKIANYFKVEVFQLLKP